MSRQNRNSVREKNSAEQKRDVANSNDRYLRTNRERSRDDREKNESGKQREFDKHRLNDLYERSSI